MCRARNGISLYFSLKTEEPKAATGIHTSTDLSRFSHYVYRIRRGNTNIVLTEIILNEKPCINITLIFSSIWIHIWIIIIVQSYLSDIAYITNEFSIRYDIFKQLFNNQYFCNMFGDSYYISCILRKI